MGAACGCVDFSASVSSSSVRALRPQNSLSPPRADPPTKNKTATASKEKNPLNENGDNNDPPSNFSPLSFMKASRDKTSTASDKNASPTTTSCGNSSSSTSDDRDDNKSTRKRDEDERKEVKENVNTMQRIVTDVQEASPGNENGSENGSTHGNTKDSHCSTGTNSPLGLPPRLLSSTMTNDYDDNHHSTTTTTTKIALTDASEAPNADRPTTDSDAAAANAPSSFSNDDNQNGEGGDIVGGAPAGGTRAASSDHLTSDAATAAALCGRTPSGRLNNRNNSCSTLSFESPPITGSVSHYNGSSFASSSDGC